MEHGKLVTVQDSRSAGAGLGTPGLVPVSMKPFLLKSTMCFDWSAGSVCCDWSTESSMFRKSHTMAAKPN